MVERPIKKSERQSQASADNDSDSKPSIESNPKRAKSNSDRSSGKRKKESFKDEAKPPVNPALARPPKPAKPPVIKAEPEPETESEPISSETTSEDSQES
jgi:hypothetical protein